MRFVRTPAFLSRSRLSPARRGARTLPPLALTLMCCGVVLATSVRAAEEPAGAGRVAVLLELNGAIGPATSEYVRQGFAAARERGAPLVILRLDTPGGLDSAMRDIIRDILASPVPVIGYVAPSGARAASAGTYILYACQLAAMAPGTNLGAATPVQIGGGSLPFGGGSGEGDKQKGKEGSQEAGKEGGKAPADAMTAKIVNDAVAYIRGLAELNGRNADWAEKAVREAASLSANAALETDVINIVAPNVRALLEAANGRTVKVLDEEVTLDTADLGVTVIEPDWRARILAVLTNPNVAYILLLLGIYGILFEFVSPGAIVPGVVGSIALLVGLFALNLLPINFAGIGLVLLGIGLMTAEAFAPSFGMLGIGGAAAFAIGSLLMFGAGVPGFGLSLSVVLTATAVSAAFFVLVIAFAWRAHTRKVVTGDSEMVGSIGRIVRWSGDCGEVHVHGERWQAHAAKPLGVGEKVRITGRDGLVLEVEPDVPSNS